jgi:hypothetical protein
LELGDPTAANSRVLRSALRFLKPKKQKSHLAFGIFFLQIPDSTVFAVLGNRQDFVAEAGASRKTVGSWELFVGTHWELPG